MKKLDLIKKNRKINNTYMAFILDHFYHKIKKFFYNL